MKGTTVATSTDVNGRYSLTVPENAATLVFSFIGMKLQEVVIAEALSDRLRNGVRCGRI